MPRSAGRAPNVIGMRTWGPALRPGRPVEEAASGQGCVDEWTRSRAQHRRDVSQAAQASRILRKKWIKAAAIDRPPSLVSGFGMRARITTQCLRSFPQGSFECCEGADGWKNEASRKTGGVRWHQDSMDGTRSRSVPAAASSCPLPAGPEVVGIGKWLGATAGSAGTRG
ncbi:hypothetical protein VUR80DRAFT_6143 [Thermomyces stellatus]